MIIKLLKDVGLIALAITILGVIGASINSMIPWGWLTYGFVILRTTAELFDVIIDLDVLYQTTGLIITAWVLYWVWYASYLVIKWYKQI